MADIYTDFAAGTNGFFSNNHFINDVSFYGQITKAKKHFMVTGEILPIVRPHIAEAWQRDRDSGYTPDMVYTPELISSSALEELLEENKLLVYTGAMIIDTICKTLNKIDFSLQLLNNQGILIYTNNEQDPNNFWTMHSYSKVGLRANDEPLTNTVTLALRHGCAFSVYGTEHFLDQYGHIVCCAVPIRDINGTILGFSNICYRADERNELLASLSFLCANMIERQLQNISYSALIDTVFATMSDRVIVLNANMEVTLANKRFQDMLGEDSAKIIGWNISSLIPESDFLKSLKTGENRTYHDIALQFNGKSYRLKIKSHTLYQESLNCGQILLCQEIDKIVSQSQKYTSAASVYFANIITNTPEMMQLIRYCETAANTDVAILLDGESGTGKDLFAQSIHNASPRKNQPFVAINCAAIPTSLLESELFGYERGSFTGALSTGKVGKFEQANHGTLFLDEIGELPLDVQGKLLRVLESHRVLRIGATVEVALDIRIIAATNQDLLGMVNTHSFRADLYYRLNIMNFHIPPLRQRHGDIRLLTKHFLLALNEKNGTSKHFSNETMLRINLYNWPGNVRELQNAVTRAYYLCDSQCNDEITYDNLALPNGARKASITEDNPVRPFSLKDAEMQLIEDSLRANNGKIKNAALALNMPLSTMYKRIRQYGIDINRLR